MVSQPNLNTRVPFGASCKSFTIKLQTLFQKHDAVSVFILVASCVKQNNKVGKFGSDVRVFNVKNSPKTGVVHIVGNAGHTTHNLHLQVPDTN